MIIFPLPVFTGRGGFPAAVPNWPPMVFPLPTFRGRGGNIVTPGPWPPMVLPSPTASSVSFVPAPTTVVLDGQAKRVNPYTTQDQINSFFRIISPRPGTGQ